MINGLRDVKSTRNGCGPLGGDNVSGDCLRKVSSKTSASKRVAGNNYGVGLNMIFLAFQFSAKM